MIRYVSLSLITLVALLPACQRPTPPVRSFVVGASGETVEEEIALRSAVQTNDGLEVLVDPATRKRCPGVREAHYGLDTAETRGELRETIEAVARCARNGASLGRTVHLRVEAPGMDHSRHRHGERFEEAFVALGVWPERVELERHLVPRDAWSQCRMVISVHDELERPSGEHALSGP